MRNDRIIDLSRRSAELLGFRNHGTATVRVKYLGRAPLNGDDSYERKYLASQSLAAICRQREDAEARSQQHHSSKRALPAENPENLAQPWQAVAPRAAAAPADPAVAGWKATTKTVQPAPPADHRLHPAQRQDGNAGRRARHPGRLVQEQGQRRSRAHCAWPPSRRSTSPRSKSARRPISGSGSGPFADRVRGRSGAWSRSREQATEAPSS